MFSKTLILFLVISASLYAQIAATEVAVLPADSKWGGGDAVGSPLIGRTYNAGNGPGIWIVADGGYRLYLNGDLLAQDNQAGRVTFVPLTFLPGKNAVSVVGVNGSGASGILVQIDDLDRSYVSGAGWKASSLVSDNTWKGGAYNDASWAAASYSGSAAVLPSGGAVGGFAPGSTAQWIWASSATASPVVLRYTFTIQAEGFGAATTGGEGGSIVVATDSTSIQSALQGVGATIILIPEGTYDIRKFRNAVTEATAAGRTWCKRQCGAGDVNSQNTHYRINFAANSCAALNDGSIPVTEGENLQSWGRWITTRANKSVIGMGRGANLRGAQIAMRSEESSSNVIFRNLAIYDGNPHLVEAGDGISTTGKSTNFTNKLWVDHVSYKWISDGLDIEYTNQGTISWLDFDGANEYNCWATDPYMALVQDAEMTYANVYWHNTYGRVPKASSSIGLTKVHMYNNYLDYNRFFIVGASGTSNTARVEVLYENNFVNGAQSRLTDKGDYGYIHWLDNTVSNSPNAKYYTNGAAGTTAPTDAVFTPPYAYSKRTVANLPTDIPQYAGVGGKWGAMPAYNQAFGQSNKAPSVTLTAPSAVASFESPATITLSASASDADGSIAKVEFFAGNVLVGSDNSAPYSVEITGVGAGVHSLIAKATDNSGLTAVSSYTTIQVAEGNKAPSFTSNDTFFVAENQTAVATLAASDPEGDPLAFSLSASSDSALFQITTMGILSFRAAPDYENPLDNGNNNIHHLMVSILDGTNIVTQKHIVIVTDVLEESPTSFRQHDKGKPVVSTSGPVFDLLGRHRAVRGVR